MLIQYPYRSLPLYFSSPIFIKIVYLYPPVATHYSPFTIHHSLPHLGTVANTNLIFSLCDMSITCTTSWMATVLSTNKIMVNSVACFLKPDKTVGRSAMATGFLLTVYCR